MYLFKILFEYNGIIIYMSKVKIKRLKLKEPFVSILRFIGIILIVLFLIFLFYRFEILSVSRLGYSEDASKNILFKFKKKYVKSIPFSKTLNSAFESSDYEEKYLSKYSDIDYYKDKNLIKTINKLLDKKYTVNEINLILSRGSVEECLEFSKKDKIIYLEEYLDFEFARIRLYDQYVDYGNDTGDSAYDTIVYVNLGINKSEYTDPTIVDKFNINMLVNKHFKLNSDFNVPDLVKVDKKYTNNDDVMMNREAYDAYIKMSDALKKEKLGIFITTAYRSYDEQKKLCDYYKKLYGDQYVKKYVAQPGFSEHQTGLAIDIGSVKSTTFASSKEYKWMIKNAYKYGYILRYTKKFEDETGFRSEAWHYRYVGVDIAKALHDKDMSYEEYYATKIFK